MTRAEFVRKQGEAAQAAGRALAESLLNQYRSKYHLIESPPPALIVDELLTEFLGARLERLPLPLNVLAQTEWFDGFKVVTVNSQIAAVPGVKDARGVENVAKLHECVHLVDHGPTMAVGQGHLPGFEVERRIVCMRGEQANKSASQAAREFWAEEAGRAAAVSYWHLQRSQDFRRLMANAGRKSNGEAWQCLYEAAKAIGVNISALVTQLQCDGLIVVERVSGRQVLHVQPSLGTLPGMAS